MLLLLLNTLPPLWTEALGKVGEWPSHRSAGMQIIEGILNILTAVGRVYLVVEDHV
jgi:hypothetical protein